MQTFNIALERLVGEGTVTFEEAMKVSNNPTDLRLRIQGLSREKGFESSPQLQMENDDDRAASNGPPVTMQRPPGFRPKK